ncbi:MAG: hypothetical protein PHH48_02630, partial [Eubacteriales bacterium]|nr:hypothetical protein [Eubacteriales bacterium]
MLIKSMPKTERPIEKAIAKGINILSNTELVALILHTGTRDKSAIHLAEDVISKDEQGIAYLGRCSLEELMEVKGIGVSKACGLLAAIELGKRIATTPKMDRVCVNSSKAVADLF